jgi:hypothetical protein
MVLMEVTVISLTHLPALQVGERWHLQDQPQEVLLQEVQVEHIQLLIQPDHMVGVMAVPAQIVPFHLAEQVAVVLAAIPVTGVMVV